MMFDPPDYPYKELCEAYDPQHLLFNNETDPELSSNSKTLDPVTMTSTNIDSQLLFNSNDSGRFFNIDSNFSQDVNDIQHNSGFIVRADNTFNYEPILLDENTVNQFLLPVPECSEKKENSVNIGPDVLALHSCIICHEIFTTETDLSEHTITQHKTGNFLSKMEILSLPDLRNNPQVTSQFEEINNNDLNCEIEWLVCKFCDRILSMAKDIEANEQFCCLDDSGTGSVLSQKLLTLYVCESCKGLFANTDGLNRHSLLCIVEEPIHSDNIVEECIIKFTSDISEVRFSCDICSKQFGNAEQLKLHLLECQKPVELRSGRHPYTSRGNSKMWNCGSCNQLFLTARDLYRHKRGEDRPDEEPLAVYVCEECDKVLGSMCALHTHKKMHKVSKPGYPCRVCGRRFNQSGHLAIHMRMHTGERPYPCDLCTKAFKVKVERDDHRRTHTGERPFACVVCPKTFTAAARLREHARIHTDQRPYRCDICGAAFRRPYARTVHTLIHTGEKPHECDICGTAFRRSGDMWKHKRTLHGSQAAIEIHAHKM